MQADAAQASGRERWVGWSLGLLMLGFGAAMFAANVVKFNAFRPGFDLAFYQQAIWNTLQGRLWQVSGSDFSNSLLGTDLIISPVIVTLPFYALWQSPLMLYALQCAVTVLGALPVYWLARDEFATRPLPGPPPILGAGVASSQNSNVDSGHGWGVAFATLYLLYPPVQNAALTEFAFRPFAALGMLFTIYYFERQRWRAFWIAAIFTLLTRSEMGLVLLLFGIYGLLKREPAPTGRVYIAAPGGGIAFLPALRWKHAATLAAVSLIYFLAATLFIVPAFAGGQLVVALDTYGKLGGSLGEVARNLITNPTLLFANNSFTETLKYLALLLVPFVFIPLLHPLRLLPALPSLLLNVLSRRTATQLSAYHYYYQVIIAVFSIWATIGALADIRRGNWWWAKLREQVRRRLAVGLVAAMFAAMLTINVGIGQLNIERGSETLSNLSQIGSSTQKWEGATLLIQQIPDGVPVAAGNVLAPHLPPRTGLWLLKIDPRYSIRPLDGAEYVIADTSYSEPSQKTLLDQVRADSARWQLLAQQGDYVLYKRLTSTR